jgi:hypothetical protein
MGDLPWFKPSEALGDATFKTLDAHPDLGYSA